MEGVQVKSELEWLEPSLPQPQQPQHSARSPNHFSKKRSSRTSPLSCGKKMFIRPRTNSSAFWS